MHNDCSAPKASDWPIWIQHCLLNQNQEKRAKAGETREATEVGRRQGGGGGGGDEQGRK